jgi:hypothetical protein
MKEALIVKFPHPEAAAKFLDSIHNAKKRYARDQFMLINKIIDEYSPLAVETALQYCLTNELKSAVDFRDAVIHFSKVVKEAACTVDPLIIPSAGNTRIPGIEVAKRDLQDMIRRLKEGDDKWLN